MTPEATKPTGTAAANAWSAGLAISLVVLLTVLGDLYAPLKDWLKTTFTHHWIGKGVLAIVVYLVGSWVLRRPSSASDDALRRGLWFVFWAASVGTIALVTFFLIEAFS